MKYLRLTLTVITCFVTTTWVMAGESQTMLTEIRATMDNTRMAELALRQEFSLTKDPEMTRRLGKLKMASRMRILQIQLKYAQAEGRAELALRIKRSIEDLRRPMAPGGPRLSGRITPSPAATPVAQPAGGSLP